MIFEYKILGVQNDLLSSANKRQAFGEQRKKTTRKSRKNREKPNKGQMDGVIVNLSITNDRRTDTDPHPGENSHEYIEYGDPGH